MVAERTQCRQPADQMQELISRLDDLENTVDALGADRRWIVRLLADIAVEQEVGSREAAGCS